MSASLIQEKFASIRKGLLEFLILKIIASDKVYVADMLRRLSTTELRREAHALPPEQNAARSAVDYEQSPTPARRAATTNTPKGKAQLDERPITGPTSTRRLKT
jgi:PadR family transcriptional regulator PadR